MARQDILLDDNNELIIENGDFKVGSSDDQHVSIIFRAFKGEIRSSPQLGFGALRYVKKIHKKIDFLRNLKLEMRKDGYSNPIIDFDLEKGKLKVEVK